MRIDRKLNLILPLEIESGAAYAHSAPLHEAVFDRYFLTITKTYAAMTVLGGAWLLTSGAQVAARMLKRVAEDDKAWDGPQGVALGLMAEIRRLTNIFTLTPSGWDMIPFETAKAQGLLTQEDAVEVENAITFFIVVCASTKKTEADSLLSAAFDLRDGQISSLSCTEFMSSLQTPTAGANTGAKAIV